MTKYAEEIASGSPPLAPTPPSTPKSPSSRSPSPSGSTSSFSPFRPFAISHLPPFKTTNPNEPTTHQGTHHPSFAIFANDTTTLNFSTSSEKTTDSFEYENIDFSQLDTFLQQFRPPPDIFSPKSSKAGSSGSAGSGSNQSISPPFSAGQQQPQRPSPLTSEYNLPFAHPKKGDRSSSGEWAFALKERGKTEEQEEKKEEGGASSGSDKSYDIISSTMNSGNQASGRERGSGSFDDGEDPYNYHPGMYGLPGGLRHRDTTIAGPSGTYRRPSGYAARREEAPAATPKKEEKGGRNEEEEGEVRSGGSSRGDGRRKDYSDDDNSERRRQHGVLPRAPPSKSSSGGGRKDYSDDENSERKRQYGVLPPPPPKNSSSGGRKDYSDDDNSERRRQYGVIPPPPPKSSSSSSRKAPSNDDETSSRRRRHRSPPPPPPKSYHDSPSRRLSTIYSQSEHSESRSTLPPTQRSSKGKGRVRVDDYGSADDMPADYGLDGISAGKSSSSSKSYSSKSPKKPSSLRSSTHPKPAIIEETPEPALPTTTNFDTAAAILKYNQDRATKQFLERSKRQRHDHMRAMGIPIPAEEDEPDLIPEAFEVDSQIPASAIFGRAPITDNSALDSAEKEQRRKARNEYRADPAGVQARIDHIPRRRIGEETPESSRRYLTNSTHAMMSSDGSVFGIEQQPGHDAPPWEDDEPVLPGGGGAEVREIAHHVKNQPSSRRIFNWMYNRRQYPGESDGERPTVLRKVVVRGKKGSTEKSSATRYPASTVPSAPGDGGGGGGGDGGGGGGSGNDIFNDPPPPPPPTPPPPRGYRLIPKSHFTLRPLSLTTLFILLQTFLILHILTHLTLPFAPLRWAYDMYVLPGAHRGMKDLWAPVPEGVFEFSPRREGKTVEEVMEEEVVEWVEERAVEGLVWALRVQGKRGALPWDNVGEGEFSFSRREEGRRREEEQEEVLVAGG